MKKRLLSEALRLALIMSPAVYLICWLLAFPYNGWDYYSRHCHIRELKATFAEGWFSGLWNDIKKPLIELW